MKHSEFYNKLVEDDTLLDFIQHAHSISVDMQSAFGWDSTPQGWRYWYNLRDTYDNPSLSSYDIKVIRHDYPEYLI